MMTAEKVNGADAVSMGMAFNCYAENVVEAESKKMAMTLAQMPTRGLGLTKKLLNCTFDNSLELQLEKEKEIQMQAGSTHDFKEGVMAFLEKRKPLFTGS